MKKIFVLIFLFQSVSSLAQVGAANSDLAELKLRMVYVNRDSFIRPCIGSPSPCGLSAEESKAANDVLAASPVFAGIEFLSIQRLTPLYTSEKIMGAKIMVNKERLLNAPFKPVAPFELYVESMLGYIFFQPSQKLVPTATLAKKFALFWGKLFRSFGLEQMNEDRIELLAFKSSEVRILLLDSYQAHILNNEILKYLKCDSGAIPGLLTDYMNMAWTQYQPAANGASATARVQLSYDCVTSLGQRQSMSTDISFEAEFIGVDKKQWNSANFLVKVNASRRGATRR